MSPRSGCSTCWGDGDVRDLLSHADGWIATATAQRWPHSEATFGPIATAGGAVYRQVRVGGVALCATVLPAGRALSRLVRGDPGDLATVLADGDGDAATAIAGQAEQLTALAAYTRLWVAPPIASTEGVMFTPWEDGATLAALLRARPTGLTGVVTALMDDLSDLHRNPPAHLSEAAATTRALPRVVAEALSHPVDHLHVGDTTAGEIGELRALAGSLSARLGRLAAQLDPMLLCRGGVAFGNLSPRGVLYPDGSSRAVLVSPVLEPGGDLVDTGTLLGHLHPLILGCSPPVRTELVDGVKAWLSGRLAASRDQWRDWLHAVLTIWAATVYDQAITCSPGSCADAALNAPSQPSPTARPTSRHGSSTPLTTDLYPFADRRCTSMAISLSRPPGSRPHPAPPAPPVSAPASPPGQGVAVRGRSTDPLIALGPKTTAQPPERAFELLRGSAVRLLDRHVQRNGACEKCGCAWPCRVVVLAENNLMLVHDAPPASASPGRAAVTPRAAASRISSHPPTPPRRDGENSQESHMTTAVVTTTASAPEPAVHLLPHRVWHYPTRPQSASAARRDVTGQLHQRNLDHVIDTITLLTSELVTNALASSLRGDDDLTSQIAMRLTYSDHHVIVEVWDGGPGHPTRRAAGLDAEDGRGLHLVTALAPRTGYHTPDGSHQKRGKVVWAALPHHTPRPHRIPTAPTDGLPRRERFAAHAATPPTPDVFDLDLLHRVRDRLRTLDIHPARPTPTGSGHHDPAT
ncbi:ATP-binding protein [Frankia sp. R43]|uniref:ATP-binding protein n=1 Tax=Frankia sp. R43 TaxID=269536 RepID=UPI000AD8A259|nr:ATP-binding protein [Frankia sp. R43]